MAWIESHQGLERHPKTVRLMELMGWNLDETVGKLHRFWWWCVDYAEDGSLDGYNNTQLGSAVGIQGEEKTRVFVENMVTARWLDRKPYFRVHNWWKYIGYFLQVKYKANPERWKSIRGRYIDNRLPAGEDGKQTPPEAGQAGKDDNGSNNGCNNPPNNGCSGGSKGGSLNSIPKPLPLKEGGKGTIPRASAEETGRLTTPLREAATAGQADTGHRTGKDEAKTPPVFASQVEEKKQGERPGPRKFVNEIMRQLKELRGQITQRQNQYPVYDKMPADKKTEYQRIKSKIRELEKELTAA